MLELWLTQTLSSISKLGVALAKPNSLIYLY
jgi:hypothetical protein